MEDFFKFCGLLKISELQRWNLFFVFLGNDGSYSCVELTKYKGDGLLEDLAGTMMPYLTYLMFKSQKVTLNTGNW